MTTKPCHHVILSLGAGTGLSPLSPILRRLLALRKVSRHTPDGEQDLFPLLKISWESRNVSEEGHAFPRQPVPLRCSISEQTFPLDSFSFPLQEHNESPLVSPSNGGSPVAISLGPHQQHMEVPMLGVESEL